VGPVDVTSRRDVVDIRDKRPPLSDHPVDVGHRTEGAILSELVRRGYAVLVPFGVNQRYDIVIDLEGRFLRAQCKTGRLVDGVVRFSTRSVRSNTNRTFTRGYVGDADVFLVHCPETARVYAVPVENAPASCMYLRVDPTVNRQAQRVHWATDYELPG
jgi:PD-(D/E)XK endonuclease